MIETVLYEHLQKNTGKLAKYLAEYNGKMAVFNQVAPPDTDRGWNNPNPEWDRENYWYDEDEDEEEIEESKSQYGRIVFAVELSEDTERKYSGTLAVDVLCEDGVQLPEEMEPIVRKLIDGYFFSTEEITMAAQWSASNYFTDPTEKVVGVTLTFGLLAFPHQSTVRPDPIALINKWTNEEFHMMIPENIKVIGVDSIGEAWKPTNKEPAIYWRLSAINPCGWIPDTYNCSWHTAVVHGHILAEDKNVSAAIARKIDNILTIKKRLIFEDGGPLMVDRNIRINLATDQLRVGQITIDATYGILYIPEPKEHIENVDITERRSTDG